MPFMCGIPPLLHGSFLVQPSRSGGNAHHAGTRQNLGAYRRLHGVYVRTAEPRVRTAVAEGASLGARQNAKDFPL